jgi:NADH:ubiquinone oxidoreductase subunit F (NADH-binding)
MILNLLKLAGVAIAVMAVVLALGYLYVMNEMRNEMKRRDGR